MDSILEFLQPENDEPHPGPGAVPDPAAADQATPDQVSDELDDDLELPATRRVNKVTAALSLALLLVGAFAAGSWVQRNHGSGSSSASATGAPGGFDPNNFPGFGGARSQGAGTGGGTGTGTAAAGPAVVGQVVSVSGTTVTVRNFGGKLVTVTVPDGVTLTSATTVPLSALKAGSTISVVGTTAADGKVTASAVTTRTG